MACSSRLRPPPSSAIHLAVSPVPRGRPDPSAVPQLALPSACRPGRAQGLQHPKSGDHPTGPRGVKIQLRDARHDVDPAGRHPDLIQHLRFREIITPHLRQRGAEPLESPPGPERIVGRRPHPEIDVERGSHVPLNGESVGTNDVLLTSCLPGMPASVTPRSRPADSFRVAWSPRRFGPRWPGWAVPHAWRRTGRLSQST